MSADDWNKIAYVLTVILGIGMVGAALAAVVAGSWPPPEWLVSWTDWLLSAVGVVFAPLALVTTAQALRKFL